VLGEAAKAEQLQAALENLCLILCKEYDDLKRAIAAYTQVSEFSMSASLQGRIETELTFLDGGYYRNDCQNGNASMEHRWYRHHRMHRR